MPFNGNGDFNLTAGNPVVPGTVIESEWANSTLGDVAAGLSQTLTADGQSTPVSNLPMGGFHHTGVSNPTLRNQYATLGMTQDGGNNRVQITGGVDNLTGTLVGGATAYTAGALVSFFAPANNTGAMTLNYNGIGPRSLVSDSGLPLVADDVVAGDFYLAIYTGTVFELLSTTSNTSSNLFQTSTTGWIRPVGGTYPVLTIATGATINVPAGQGYIVPPGNTGNENATLVSWDAQTITLQYVASSFSTTITVDQSGTIVQYAGRVIGSAVRTHAVIGVVQHFNGIASTVTTQPSIFGDDGYLNRATATLLNALIVSGCKVAGNGTAPLAMDISEGIIFVPGASSQNPDSPNTISVPQQSQLQFKTLAGESTVGSTVLTNAPVTQYDQNGAGVVTAIPANNDVTIHRLYYLYGQFIWVFGQFIYTSLDNALINIEVDRTKRLTSTRLAGATLLAEIITNKSNTSLSNVATAILAKGSQYFSIGSAGGIGEAPVDGNAYGRQDATWVPVVKGTNPQLTGTVTITGSNPKTVQVASPVVAGYMGFQAKQLAFDWCNMEITYPDDKTYFRSYNPANGNLRNSTTWDLATGNWTFPDNVDATTFNGVDINAIDASVTSLEAEILLKADTASVDAQLSLKAPLSSPALTDNPTAPTKAAGDASTSLATTAYVDRQADDQVLSNYLKIGEVILSWGAVTSSATSDVTYTYPIANPNFTVQTQVTCVATGAGAIGNYNSGTKTNVKIAAWSTATAATRLSAPCQVTIIGW